MRNYLREKSKFDIKYFLQGPYKGAKIEGKLRLFGKYYWARRFYAKIIERLTTTNGKILEIECEAGFDYHEEVRVGLQSPVFWFFYTVFYLR